MNTKDKIDSTADINTIIEEMFPEPIIDQDWLIQEERKASKEIKRILENERIRLHEQAEYYRNKRRLQENDKKARKKLEKDDKNGGGKWVDRREEVR